MHTSTENNLITTGTSENYPLWQRILLGLVIFVLLLIPLLVFELAVQPFRRGFFCDDETIRYPHKDSTITVAMLVSIVAVPAIIILAIGEYVLIRNNGENCCQIAIIWAINFFKQFAYYCFGILFVCNVTEVGKFTIGRLRPHFMAVCQPQITDGTTCNDLSNLHRYVDNYNCLGIGYSEDRIRHSRLSFPSGHSTLTFYALVYMSLYLQKVMHWRRSDLVKPFIQFLLVLLAWFISLTRVMDRRHHSLDVFAGALIGIFGALFTAYYVSKLFRASHTNLGSLRLSNVTRIEAANRLLD